MESCFSEIQPKQRGCEDIGNEGAEYGKQLTEEYGKGWGEKQLRMCMHFVVFALLNF